MKAVLYKRPPTWGYWELRVTFYWRKCDGWPSPVHDSRPPRPVLSRSSPGGWGSRTQSVWSPCTSRSPRSLSTEHAHKKKKKGHGVTKTGSLWQLKCMPHQILHNSWPDEKPSRAANLKSYVLWPRFKFLLLATVQLICPPWPTVEKWPCNNAEWAFQAASKSPPSSSVFRLCDVMRSLSSQVCETARQIYKLLKGGPKEYTNAIYLITSVTFTPTYFCIMMCSLWILFLASTIQVRFFLSHSL